MVANCSRACVKGRLSLGEGEEEGEDRSQDAANCPNPSPLSSPIFLRREARKARKRLRRFHIPRSRQQARNTQYPVAGAFRNPMNGVFSLVTPEMLLY